MVDVVRLHVEGMDLAVYNQRKEEKLIKRRPTAWISQALCWERCRLCREEWGWKGSPLANRSRKAKGLSPTAASWTVSGEARMAPALSRLLGLERLVDQLDCGSYGFGLHWDLRRWNAVSDEAEWKYPRVVEEEADNRG